MSTEFSQFIKRHDQRFSRKNKACNCSGCRNCFKEKREGGINDLIALLSPQAGEHFLDQMAWLSSRLTVQRFGNTIRLFAPIYLSNECNNICDYCGFSMHNKIARKTLTDPEILRERAP